MTIPSLAPAEATTQRASLRAWSICGLLLLATMLMYMDRLTLSQQSKEIRDALGLSNEDYGRLESGFGFAFAFGGIVAGLLVDRIGARWLYPIALFGWSSVGFATGWVTSFNQLLICRILLGFFEAGHWPCALLTSQRLLSSRDRPLGNSILQSGAAIGSIVTPIIVLLLTTNEPDSWRLPFRVIGASGIFWVVAWLSSVRRSDFTVRDSSEPAFSSSAPDTAALPDEAPRSVFVRRMLALTVVVITINMCFQYFRAWMPGMLESYYGYSKEHVQQFSIAYYIATDIGCLSVGFLVKWLAVRGFGIHRARMATFFVCCLLTTLSVLVALLPASPLLLMTLLVVGFGSLGQFPVYYALTQELSTRRMGRVTAALGFMTWTAWALIQPSIGSYIDRTHTYTATTLLAGTVPMLGFLALLLLWNPSNAKRSAGDL
jgi:ACS family hexuronate transporter-like MFS transporter